MRCCGFEFRPTVWPTLAFIVVLPILLSLGNWQLQRAAEKVAMLTHFAAARDAATLSADALSGELDWSQLQYRNIAVTGVLDADRQLLLDNRVHRQRAGFEVLTPVQLSDGRWLLVNRGWLAPGPSREQLPEASLSSNAEVALRGVLVKPSQAFALGEALAGDRGSWPRVLQFYDFAALSALLEAELLPAVVYLDADQPGVLTHTWRPLPEGPEKHYSYATQWFVMAAVVLMLYFMLNTRRVRREESDK